MITIEEYFQAKQRVEELNKEQKGLQKEHDEEHQKLKDYYWEMERALRDRKNQEFKELEQQHNEQNDDIKSRIEPHGNILAEYRTIMILMETHKNERDPNDFKVYKYDYPRDETGEVIHVQRGNCLDYPDKIEILYTPIDTIKDDKYSKIQVFIVENNKPKNKYTLMIAGGTIFPEKIIKSPYYYGYPCQTTGTNILLGIADRPTKEELKTYYLRNKDKIKLLTEYLQKHKEIEQKYETVIATTDNKQWEIQYWLHKKDYWENHCSHGTEHTEYQQVLQQLKKLEGN